MSEKNKEKKVKQTLIGGQALMEGVMMRGASSMAMAVRAPDGTIMLETERLKAKHWYSKVPIIRGVVSFVLSLVSGIKTLMRSAEVSSPEEETPGKGWMAFAVILGVVLAIGLFILLPGFLSDIIFIDKIKAYLGVKLSILLQSLFEGILRIIIFVLYLFFVSRTKDIRRTFMYHGAEHRTINCYEKGYEMTVENVQKCSTRHNRCGTTFLFLVMIVSILIFALTRWALSYIPLSGGRSWSDSRWILTVARLVLLPIIAGLSYEVLRGLAKLPDNSFTNILRAPGLAMQRLTTYPPDDDMAEVALKSFLAVLNMDADQSIPPVKFGEYNPANVRRELCEALLAYGLDERETAAETDWILCGALKMRRNELVAVKKIGHADYKAAMDILARRISGEPLDYIFGESEFYGNKVKVTPDVLIPRMETEILCEQAIKLIGEREVRVLDLCTGSGCIAQAILKATRAKAVAADISESALSVARQNLNGLDAEVVLSDLFNSVEGTFDYIVSNPPYIASDEIQSLAAEVKCQPVLALDGGGDGLDFYRRIKEGYRTKLNNGGALIMEIGYNQAESVKSIFSEDATAEVIKDLDGNDRVVIVKPN